MDQPSASLANIRQRAALLAKIRKFFADRDILEVETPLIYPSSVPDPHVASLTTQVNQQRTCYLQTSPEFAMKRLLASGSGAIYQICKAFRDGEVGRKHNPEFTLLEWYRPGFDHHALMQEVDALLQATIQTPKAEYITYQAVFAKFCDLNPHKASIQALQQCVAKLNIALDDHAGEQADENFYLDVLMSHHIEAQLGLEQPVFIYDYPASQAALAKIRHQDPPVAERFELYYKGIELANGFHELNDQQEQRKRFEKDLVKRKQLDLPLLPLDEKFLTSLDALPDCAGVALGVDRLLMLSVGATQIEEILTFPHSGF